MTILSVHDKKSNDVEFIKFLPIIKTNSIGERNFVKKSVNWALRQIGKKNSNLNEKAIETANEILKSNSKTAKWVASNALLNYKMIVYEEE